MKCGKTTKSQLFGLPVPQPVGGPLDGRFSAGRGLLKYGLPSGNREMRKNNLGLIFRVPSGYREMG